MKLGDFIIQYRREHKLSQRQFAQACGISNVYINMIENDNNTFTNRPVVPSIKILKKVANGMGITLQELVGVIDDIEVSLEEEKTPEEQYKEIQNIVNFPKSKKIPLVGEIACGKPIIANAETDEYAYAPEFIHADFALRCKGDSMINARIFDGDIVYLRSQNDVENGEIAAVIIDDVATLKRVRKYKDRIILEPENPTIKPMVFWGEDMDSIHIIGKAVAFTSLIE